MKRLLATVCSVPFACTGLLARTGLLASAGLLGSGLSACTGDVGFDDEEGTELETDVTEEALVCATPQMSVFPVAAAHNIGYDGRSCGSGTCAVSCPDRNANSDWNSHDHQGIDVFAHRRAPLVAVAGGTIVRVGVVSDTSGIRVRLRDRCGWEYYYGHLDQAVVSQGQRVSAGQIIGYMGNTGTGGVHLHFNISPDGQYANDINPFDLLRATSGTACGGSPTPVDPTPPPVDPSPTPTPAPTPSPTPGAAPAHLVFDPVFYLGRYEDLAGAFGGDTNAALVHWQTYGIAEGRRGSPEFDAPWYLAANPDVAAYYGAGNYAGAIQHFLEHGVGEGRAGSAEVQASYYLAIYGDLSAAFGATSYAAALDHYRTHGLGEGRRASASFDPSAYLSRYPDLRAAFGSDHRAALVHWLRWGQLEGRSAGP